MLVLNCGWKLLSYLASRLTFFLFYTRGSACAELILHLPALKRDFFFIALSDVHSFPFQKEQSIMNISVLHNLLVTFFLFKVRHAGQGSALNDYEYRVVNHIFCLLGFFWNLSF